MLNGAGQADFGSEILEEPSAQNLLSELWTYGARGAQGCGNTDGLACIKQTSLSSYFICWMDCVEPKWRRTV